MFVALGPNELTSSKACNRNDKKWIKHNASALIQHYKNHCADVKYSATKNYKWSIEKKSKLWQNPQRIFGFIIHSVWMMHISLWHSNQRFSGTLLHCTHRILRNIQDDGLKTVICLKPMSANWGVWTAGLFVSCRGNPAADGFTSCLHFRWSTLSKSSTW